MNSADSFFMCFVSHSLLSPCSSSILSSFFCWQSPNDRCFRQNVGKGPIEDEGHWKATVCLQSKWLCQLERIPWWLCGYCGGQIWIVQLWWSSACVEGNEKDMQAWWQDSFTGAWKVKDMVPHHQLLGQECWETCQELGLCVEQGSWSDCQGLWSEDWNTAYLALWNHLLHGLQA